MFADPEFDGDPALISEEHIDEKGKSEKYETIDENPDVEDQEVEWESSSEISDDSEGQRRKYYFDEGQVEIAAHLVYELDPDGKQLRVVQYTDYAGEKVRTLYPSAVDLRKKWADPAQRSEIIARLEERGISFDELRSATNQPEADPFDLLCHVTFNTPVRTRRERADQVKREQKVFFNRFGPQAKDILDELLEKYADHGTAQFAIPDVLKVPPISEHGNIIEIAAHFGGPEKLREAINELQTLLYAA